MWHEVAFPRDGTSRCPFLPGQGQEKKIPGQTPLSRDVLGQKELINFTKLQDFLFQEIIFLFQNILSCFRASFFVLETSFSRFLVSFGKVIFVLRGPGTEEFVPEFFLLPLSRDRNDFHKKVWSLKKGFVALFVRKLPWSGF